MKGAPSACCPFALLKYCVLPSEPTTNLSLVSNVLRNLCNVAVYVCMYVCMYVYVCMFVCMYVCMYVLELGVESAEEPV